MSATGDAVPFRWDISRREQLGRLSGPLEGEPDPGERPIPFRELLTGVRELAARVVARSGDARLVFVGRSLENVHDYLGAALAGTPCADRPSLLGLSIDVGSVRSAPPAARAALRAHLDALELSPAAVAAAPRPVAMVDVVYRGSTFGGLSHALQSLAREEGVDPAAVRRRLRWVGLTVRGHNTPNAWRWFQRAEWTREYPRGALRGVSIDYGVWQYLGNQQAKTTPSNPASRWTEERRPPRAREHQVALRVARRIHERAATREERLELAALLARRPEMREPWLRTLVVALRR